MDDPGPGGRMLDPLALALTAFFALLIAIVVGLLLVPNIL